VRDRLRSPFDDLIFSDSDASDINISDWANCAQPGERAPTTVQGALQSAEWSVQVRTPSGHAQPRKSSQVAPAKIKAPRLPPKSIGRASTRMAEHRHSRTNTNRRSATMVGPGEERNRLSGPTNRVRTHPEDWLRDSDSSDDGNNDPAITGTVRRQTLRPSRVVKAVSGSTSQLRNGGRTRSVGAAQHSGVLLRGPRANQGARAAAAYSSPSLPNQAVEPVTVAEAAVLTISLDDTAEIGALLRSPTAWGLTGELSHTARLIGAVVKPCTTTRWQLTATFCRGPSDMSTTRDPDLDTASYSPASDGDDGRSEMDSIHHHPSDVEPETRARGTRRGG
jgi:hypothetical protein